MTVPNLTEGSVLSFTPLQVEERVNAHQESGKYTVLLLGWAVVLDDVEPRQTTRIEPVVLIDNEALTAAQAQEKHGLTVEPGGALRPRL